MEIIEATFCDIERILEIMNSARAFQRAMGFVQWLDGYPSHDDIMNDISNGGARIFTVDDKIIGYAYLTDFDNEYNRLNNIWKFGNRYGVIHRLAVDAEYRGHGCSTEMLQLIENEFKQSDINAIRIDTGTENIVMQHLLSKSGYECRDQQSFIWGERLAYEKKLQ